MLEVTPDNLAVRMNLSDLYKEMGEPELAVQVLDTDGELPYNVRACVCVCMCASGYACMCACVCIYWPACVFCTRLDGRAQVFDLACSTWSARCCIILSRLSAEGDSRLAYRQCNILYDDKKTDVCGGVVHWYCF